MRLAGNGIRERPDAILVVVVLTGALAAATPTHVAVRAATHTPKINTRWTYTVQATRDGNPERGRITVQIVDPIGGVHPVEFGANTKNVTNIPFNGTFRDYMIFPSSARGIPLKIRVTLVVGTSQR